MQLLEASLLVAAQRSPAGHGRSCEQCRARAVALRPLAHETIVGWSPLVRPARPHQQLTEDGRRMREVLSYSRRGSRFTPSQAEAWEAYADGWVIPDEAVDDPQFSLTTWFGREAPLIVEIGPGVGEATGVLAAARPDLRRAGARGVAARGRSRTGRGGDGGRDQRAVLLGRRGLVARAPGRRRTRSPSSGRSSPTRGPRSGTTSDGWWAGSSRPSRRPACAPVAAWRLATDWARLRRADARRARRGAGAGRWRGGAVGRAAGHEVRAQGPRGRPLDHRPLLPRTALEAGPAGGGPGLDQRCLDALALRWSSSGAVAGGRRAGGRAPGRPPASARIRSIRLPSTLVLREPHAVLVVARRRSGGRRR